METQNYIEYELSNPVSDRLLITESREEATAYFEKDWTAYEHHISITRLKYTSTRVDVATIWNNNPELSEE